MQTFLCKFLFYRPLLNYLQLLYPSRNKKYLNIYKYKKFLDFMVAISEILERIKKIMKNQEHIRNIGLIAHVDHGKTTTASNLIAGAGLLSMERAGKELKATDYDPIEAQRQMTIKSAEASLVYNYKGEDYLINLVDTPGHVDFGGYVTQAVRVMDGAIVVVDCVEGVMPQTETVLRQALKEAVKPILFLNKIDRLVKELNLTPEEMQKRLIKAISQVNDLIYKYAPEEFKKDWQLKVNDGTVAFGSAYDGWGISIPIMKETGITFKDIIEAYKINDAKEREEAIKKIRMKAPLFKVLLEIVINHLPNPKEAQKYKIPRIWHGELESEVGKALLNCDINGPAVACVNKVRVDPQAGELAVARLFSGVIRRGDEVYLNNARKRVKLQQLMVWKGKQGLAVDEITAGNIFGIAGIKGIRAGETISKEPVTPFEEIKHIFEPVVTKAMEPKNPQELEKVINALNKLATEDFTLKVNINKETGQILVSGLGELHLEIVETKIKRDYGVEVKAGNPIVVYRETVTKESPIVEGKSPNKHNKFYIKVEPMKDEIYDAIVSGEIPEGRYKGKEKWLHEKLIKLGMDREDAKRVIQVYKGNMFIDNTSGIVHIGEVIGMCLDAFKEVMNNGPLAKESCSKIVVRLMDAVLHEDAIHRGPAQVIPAVRDAIVNAIKQASPILLEPVQIIRIDFPSQFLGDITSIINSRRGQILEMTDEVDHTIIKAKIPVANLFGFETVIKSATQGRGFWSLIDSKFEPLPKDLQEEVIRKIRERKGLSIE